MENYTEFQVTHCAVYHQYGTPIFATCKTCDYINIFQKAANNQINDWLNGKKF
jgi:hypothetical protein